MSPNESEVGMIWFDSDSFGLMAQIESDWVELIFNPFSSNEMFFGLVQNDSKWFKNGFRNSSDSPWLNSNLKNLLRYSGVNIGLDFISRESATFQNMLPNQSLPFPVIRNQHFVPFNPNESESNFQFNLGLNQTEFLIWIIPTLDSSALIIWFR